MQVFFAASLPYFPPFHLLIGLFVYGINLFLTGSSLYLKSKFGVGYLLTMVKNANYKPQQLENLIKEYPVKNYLSYK